MTSQIEDAIVLALCENGGEIAGTERLAIQIGCIDNKVRVVRRARDAEKNGMIVIERSTGGRGNKTRYLCHRARCSKCERASRCPLMKKHPRFNQPIKVVKP